MKREARISNKNEAAIQLEIITLFLCTTMPMIMNMMIAPQFATASPIEYNKIKSHHNSLADCQSFKQHAKPEMELIEGENVTLPCEVERQESVPVWKVNKNPITFDENGTVPYFYKGFDNFSILKKVFEGTDASAYNLLITNIRLNDTGDYECTVLGTIDDSKKHRKLTAKTRLTVIPKQQLFPDDSSSQQQAELAINSQTNSDDQYKLMDLNNNQQTQQTQTQTQTQTLSDLLNTKMRISKQLQQSEQEKNSRRDTNSLLTRLTAPSESGSSSSSSYSNFPSAFTSPHASPSSFNKHSRPLYMGGSATSISSASGLLAAPTSLATSSSPASGHHNHAQSSFFNGSQRSGFGAFVAATWPYALVLVALSLMMINLYLIFSLVKLQRRKKKRTTNQEQARQSRHQQQQQQNRHQQAYDRGQPDCSI